MPQDQSSRSDKDDADGDDAAADPRDQSKKSRAKASVDQVVMNDEVEDDDDDDRVAEDSHPSTDSSLTFKLQPSKRRTNGKKRQSVPECMLS